jgi:hypothetical protein
MEEPAYDQSVDGETGAWNEFRPDRQRRHRLDDEKII